MTKIKIFLTCIGFTICTSFSLLAQTPLEDAQAYLKANSLKFGLNGDDISDIEVSASHVSSASGIKHIYYTQKFKGVSVYGTYSSQHYNSKGEFIHINNAFIPNLERGITNKIPAPQLSSIEAIEKVASALSLSIKSPLQIISNIGNEEQKAVISDGGISLENIPVKLIYFPRANSLFTTNSKETKSPYVIDLAWEMYIYEANQNNYWYLIVDAFSGNILYKNNLVVSCGFDEANHAHHDHPQLNEESSETSRAFNVNVAGSSMMVGGYRVYPMPIESPGHGARSLINNPDNALASPFGWHDTNGAAGPEFTITRGNNTHAYEDGNNPGFSPDGFAPLVFDFPINTTYMVGVDESEPAIITNLFYWTNIIHDVTYQYGFTEAAGNFQVNNYGRGGLGNDDCRAEAQDGSGTCNANFGTPPDGSRPTMQMYICGTRDGDIDNGVILHEYGHGISNRLTGGPSNVNCLNNAEQMGEGWSDWYAIVMTIEPGDMGPDRRPIGTWLFGQPPTGAGIRAFPYSTSLAIDPRTYNTIKTSAIPHGVGSVWCAMLWEVTWELINTYGYDANFYTGNGGNNRALRLITEAMKLQPCSPGFVDGRDAILLADRNIYNGANQCAIWRAFAKRGLGLSATQGSTNSVTDGTEAFDVPVACQAAPPTMVCFDYTGGMQTWVVPAGITSITIDAYGAAGATALNSVNVCGGSPDRGGLGGYAKGTLTVTPGETLNIFVGGAGQNSGAGAFNGGGAPCADPNTCSGGGGASDVRQGGSALANRRIVAGGGGGAEFSCGGQGGGAGGGLTGADALGGDCNPSGSDGKGGTQAAGGNGGVFGNCGFPALSGGNGSLGLGGNAPQGVGTQHAAGGGGGYYGGGGGATDGSAGGGSSYIGGVTSGSTTPGLRTGNGNICISFAAAPLTITCPAPVTVGCATSVPAPDINAPTKSGGCPPLVVTHRGDVITNQTCANRYTVTRTYRVTDACQATAECTQIITVNDITHPSIICPAATSVACASLVPAPDVNLVIAADLCGNVGIIKEFVSDVITNQTCANRYTITRTYRATDVCGNSGTCAQTITVNDQIVPVITCKNITVSIPLSGTLILTPTDMIVSASDNCGGAAGVTLSASQTSFTCADLGVKSITVRATDACGLFSTCIASVTVQDNILPVINCSKDYTVHLDPGECS
ncbi:MAG: M36 family metallopeptidase, partial [Saprospiraceae bacterium]|nr:M36 family metallopeptidase [Saprospiraceae bacterium]